MRVFAERTLGEFFRADQAKVLAVRGDWGSGKTWFVRETAKQFSEVRLVYVSLFGTNSILDIRRELCAAVAARVVGGKESRTAALVRAAAELPRINEIKDALAGLTDLLLNNAVIVFDDLERRGQNVSIRDVLGLANYFFEHRKCKVVLILNETELPDTDRNELNNLREKLISSELLFAPSVSENVDISFEASPWREFAKSIFQTVDCRNLRIQAKCRQHASWLSEHIPLSANAEVKERVITEGIMTACLYYLEPAWAFKFAAADKATAALMFGDMPSTMKKLAFVPTPNTFSFVRYFAHGYLPDSDFEALSLRQSSISGVGEEIQGLQNLFAFACGDFSGTLEEFRSRATDFLELHAAQLSWRDLGSLLNLLAQLLPEIDPLPYREAFILSRVDKFDYDSCSFFLPLCSGAAKAAVEKRLSELKSLMDPWAAVAKIVTVGSWFDQDTAAVASLSAADWLDLIRTKRGNDVQQLVGRFVRIARGADQIPDLKASGKRLEESLRILASANTLTRFKVAATLEEPFEAAGIAGVKPPNGTPAEAPLDEECGAAEAERSRGRQ